MTGVPASEECGNLIRFARRTPSLTHSLTHSLSHTHTHTRDCFAPGAAGLQVVQYIIEECDGNMDVQNERGATPLLLACKLGNVACAKSLLEHGAGPHLVNDKGYSALHIAAKYGQLDCITLLLRMETGMCGGVPCAVDCFCFYFVGLFGFFLFCVVASRIAMHKARFPSPFPYPVIFGLLPPPSPVPFAPLRLCTTRRSGRQLLEARAAPLSLYPLHLAAKYGHVAVAETLLRAGASVARSDNNGKTPMHFGVYAPRATILALLRKWGGRPNLPDHALLTPLHEAALIGNVDAVRSACSWLLAVAVCGWLWLAVGG